MYTLSAKLTFYILYAASLKDKRQVSRSLIDRTKGRFNVSVAEVATQDLLQTLTVGIAMVSSDAAYLRQSLDSVIHFMESDTDAELIKAEIY